MRNIKPHKGGRNLTIRARLTEAEKKIVDTARKKLSYADYLVGIASKGVRTKTPNSAGQKIVERNYHRRTFGT